MKPLSLVTSHTALLGAMFTFFALSASAQDVPEGECASDADCPENGVCQKETWTDGCAPTPEGGTSHCDSSVHEAEFGICYVPPPECGSDADCEEYMTCQESGSSGSCSISSSGEMSCTDPEPGPKYCAPMWGGECESDADCPREFTCTTSAACNSDRYCPDDPNCGCPMDAPNQCQPKDISCTSDDMCPSDWTCVISMGSSCDGGDPDEPPTGSDPVGGPTPDGSGDMGSGSGTLDEVDEVDEPEKMRVDSECEPTPTTGYCSPSAWADAGYGGVVRGDDPKGETAGDLGGSDPNAEQPPMADPQDSDDTASGEAEEGATDESADEVSGCSVVSSPAPRGSSWWLSPLLLVPFLRRRRQSSVERV